MSVATRSRATGRQTDRPNRDRRRPIPKDRRPARPKAVCLCESRRPIGSAQSASAPRRRRPRGAIPAARELPAANRPLAIAAVVLEASAGPWQEFAIVRSAAARCLRPRGRATPRRERSSSPPTPSLACRLACPRSRSVDLVLPEDHRPARVPCRRSARAGCLGSPLTLPAPPGPLAACRPAANTLPEPTTGPVPASPRYGPHGEAA